MRALSEAVPGRPARRSRRLSAPSMVVGTVGTVGVAWFALWACAPMSTMPVPGAIDSNTSEFGVGGNATFGAASTTSTTIAPGIGESGQFWYDHRFGKFDFGGGVFAGNSSLVGGGLFFGGMFPVGKINLGFEIAGGFLWAEAGIPLTVPLGDHAWLYTEPSIGIRAQLARLPVGVGFRLGKHFMLAPEVAVEYGATTSPIRPTGTFPQSLAFTGAFSAGYGF